MKTGHGDFYFLLLILPNKANWYYKNSYKIAETLLQVTFLMHLPFREVN